MNFLPDRVESITLERIIVQTGGEGFLFYVSFQKDPFLVWWPCLVLFDFKWEKFLMPFQMEYNLLCEEFSFMWIQPALQERFLWGYAICNICFGEWTLFMQFVFIALKLCITGERRFRVSRGLEDTQSIQSAMQAKKCNSNWKFACCYAILGNLATCNENSCSQECGKSVTRVTKAAKKYKFPIVILIKRIRFSIYFASSFSKGFKLFSGMVWQTISH